jgi:hypothetical protein
MKVSHYALIWLLGHIKKIISYRPFDLKKKGRGGFFKFFYFFDDPKTLACVRTRTMQTSIESTPWPT